MVETSGSGSLDPRQACSVEAAARSSGGVVVVMTSQRLHLTDNTTCFLLNSLSNVQFYTVNFTNLGLNTALGQHRFVSSSVPVQSYCRNFPQFLSSVGCPQVNIDGYKGEKVLIILLKVPDAVQVWWDLSRPGLCDT